MQQGLKGRKQTKTPGFIEETSRQRQNYNKEEQRNKVRGQKNVIKFQKQILW